MQQAPLLSATPSLCFQWPTEPATALNPPPTTNQWRCQTSRSVTWLMTFQSGWSGTKKVSSWQIWSVWRKGKRHYWGQRATPTNKSNMTDRCSLIMHRWWRATVVVRALLSYDSNSDSLLGSTPISKVTLITNSLFCHSISKTTAEIISLLAVHMALLITNSNIQMQAWAALILYLRPISQPIVPTTTQALRWWIRSKSSQAQFKATIHLARRLKEDSPLILLRQVEIIIWRQICSNIIMVVVTLITTQQLLHLITNSASISNQSSSIATWAKIRPNLKWPHHPQHTVLNRN